MLPHLSSTTKPEGAPLLASFARSGDVSRRFTPSERLLPKIRTLNISWKSGASAPRSRARVTDAL